MKKYIKPISKVVSLKPAKSVLLITSDFNIWDNSIADSPLIAE